MGFNHPTSLGTDLELDVGAWEVFGNWRITFVFREGHAFNTTPALWLGLQQEYDLWHARHDTKEWRQVKAVREIATLPV